MSVVVNYKNIKKLDLSKRVSYLLLKRWGVLKSVVIKIMQYILFHKTLKKHMLDIEKFHKTDDRLEHFVKISKYIYNNRDIYMRDEIFTNTLKKKIFEFASKAPEMFQEYLVSFGYICPYPKYPGGELCSKKVNGGLCPKHTRSVDLLSINIDQSLPTLPRDICYIVLKYTLPYS